MDTPEVLKEEKNKDFPVEPLIDELPTIIYKIKALGTLLQNFECQFAGSLSPLDPDDLRGISAILLDIGQELQTINDGLYREE